MGLDRTRWPELMLGLDRVRVLEVARDSDGRLHVAIETTDTAVACRPARAATTAAVGVDETKFLAAKAKAPTRWVSAICDVADRHVVDVIEGRQGPELDAWLTARPATWKESVKVTVTDLHEPFRKALAEHLPTATAVADASLSRPRQTVDHLPTNTSASVILVISVAFLVVVAVVPTATMGGGGSPRRLPAV